MKVGLILWLMASFLSCLGRGHGGVDAFNYTTVALGSGQPLLVQCDHSEGSGMTLIGMNLWHLSQHNEMHLVASIEKGTVTPAPPYTSEEVYGMQLSVVILLTLDIKHPTQSQLGGYICSLQYKTHGGEDRTAIVDYVNYVTAGEMNSGTGKR